MSDFKSTILPDGSAFFTASSPLPNTHWIYETNTNPPMTMRIRRDHPQYKDIVERIRIAAKYAIRSATMSGKDNDFDPDALIQNLVVGLLGYHTPDGLSDDFDNPKPIPELFFK